MNMNICHSLTCNLQDGQDIYREGFQSEMVSCHTSKLKSQSFDFTLSYKILTMQALESISYVKSTFCIFHAHPLKGQREDVVKLDTAHLFTKYFANSSQRQEGASKLGETLFK
jgi:hypothetical protein